MFGDWSSLAFVLVGICVVTLHILRLHREAQDRRRWIEDMTERQRDRADWRKIRERQFGPLTTPDPESFKEEGAWY